MIYTKTKLYALAMVSAALIAASPAHASPIFFTDLTDFNNALGGENLSVEDFETLTSNTPSGKKFGHVKIETGDDIDRGPFGINGPNTLKIAEDSDDFVKFTFDATIVAFGIFLIDALDQGGGSIFVTIDGGSPVEVVGPLGDQDDLEEIFIGVIDLDGFTMVKIDATDNHDLVFLDNLLHTKIVEPATIAVFGLGLAGLGYMRRRRSI